MKSKKDLRAGFGDHFRVVNILVKTGEAARRSVLASAFLGAIAAFMPAAKADELAAENSPAFQNAGENFRVVNEVVSSSQFDFELGNATQTWNSAQQLSDAPGFAVGDGGLEKGDRVREAQRDRSLSQDWELAPQSKIPNHEPNFTKQATEPVDVPALTDSDDTSDGGVPAPKVEETSFAANEVRIVNLHGITRSDHRTTNLVIQYSNEATPLVTLNGKPLKPENSQIEKSQITTQIWYNIPLETGENTITAQVGDGPPASVVLQVAETKAKIEITPTGDPRVVADGRSTLTLSGSITDENGELFREDVRVTLSASAGKFVGADQDKDEPGFQVLARGGQFTATLQSGLDAQQVRIRAAIDRNQGIEDNQSTAAENPQLLTSNPQPVTPNIQPTSPNNGYRGSESSDRSLQSQHLPSTTEVVEAYTQVEFITYLRPSLATGVINLRIGAAGTDYWGSFREFLNPEIIDNGTEVDLDASVFATGAIGEWLFTGAYNSDRALNQDCENRNRLFGGNQFCEQQYPVYGDSSTSTSTAPSIDSVYARIERTSPVVGAEPDYFMWGDYNTQEFARASQLFTATTRQLHGFKANYNIGNLQVTGLYSNNIQGFQRDAIAPNGTSGYYFLSHRLVIPGSENVFLETEEINRPGTVVERKPLLRGTDYEIDYDRGTLLFRRPILSTEFNPFGTTLVRRIVATYQNEAAGETSLYAGRLQYNFREQDAANFLSTPFIGASYLREDQGIQDFELYGLDFLVPLGESGQIVGEYARSSHNAPLLGDVDGSAYRLEAYGNITPNIQGRAYYRSVEENFANNATFSFTPGQTRYGAQVSAALSSTTSLQAGYDHEENFGIAPAIRSSFFDLFDPQPLPTPGSRVDNELTTIRAGVVQKFGAADLSLEYVNRDRQDRASDLLEGDASQLVSRLNVPLSETLTFRAQNELNLGDRDQLYPNRTTFGVDWAVYPGVTMRLAHQFYDGTGLLRGNSITSLDTILEHKFSDDTSVTGRYTVLNGFNSTTGQGAIGLNHRIRLAPGLRLNLGYERVFDNLFGNTAAGPRFAQPYAVGQSAATLGLFSGNSYSVGLEYTDNPDFQASARFEYRDGSEGNNTVISAAAAGKLSPALTALVRYQQAGGSSQLLEALGDTSNFKIGLAYRDPSNDKLNALLRYEYRQNPSTIPDTLLIGSGTGSTDHLFAAEAIYAPSWRWEFYSKLALRNSTSYLADTFSYGSTVYLGQLRASYRLGYRTDLAVEGRLIGQPSEGYNETGFAVEGGYYLTPDLRVGVGYSFGSVDDRDFTGYRSEGGPYLNLTFKLNELFGGFGRQKPAPRQQRESEVPVARSDRSADFLRSLSPGASKPGEFSAPASEVRSQKSR